MNFRPCIDIHNGKVKQIVGSSLKDQGDVARENFVATKDAAFYANMYKALGLSGGHIILLNPVDSPFYEGTKKQALEALKTAPGLLQVGGGITADNAQEFLEAGASHVIVTSYVFKNGKINYTNLNKLVKAVGKERIVLDLSCKAQDDKYYIVTDRWQKMTDVELNAETLDTLSEYCDEILVHAADVEGKQNGIEENVAAILGKWAKLPITYAGGVHSISDVKQLKKLGKSKIDVTVGSALEIFGGSLKIEDIVKACQ
ncbi:1-(5-phosphoribosyl)-5-[(5-phosphoribosylamino)methylideneamino] imidazole-4-carboxamide isomerase [Butyrivibrio sp. INlla18]|uniref:phosphoribosylformimino-5-aminoimidazole carboxamide ribotide isomerase n=1 Tax=Butyrivibrio sp. INlla18 TaxID=1520806 RepID=UPI00088FA65A|nr:phosphoribosylformimino-5-aminoimidazole carboxamide ribotide isomerase [Butyrivibrio sp. INlla18]SDA48436.1 1-(5-phosphoribosyl)-5-[(5-phosphoribosylamino)methylideneamino] imidazole-4-carboxamide isomerase [Butyrivibrio sp. INlla18]